MSQHYGVYGVREQELRPFSFSHKGLPHPHPQSLWFDCEFTVYITSSL